jgi:hypothetical protein
MRGPWEEPDEEDVHRNESNDPDSDHPELFQKTALFLFPDRLLVPCRQVWFIKLIRIVSHSRRLIKSRKYLSPVLIKMTGVSFLSPPG